MTHLERALHQALTRPGGDARIANVELALVDVHRGARRLRRRRRVAVIVAACMTVLLVAGGAVQVSGALNSTRPDPASDSDTGRQGVLLPLGEHGMDTVGTTGFDLTSSGQVWQVSAERCGRVLCARVLREDDDSGWETLTRHLLWRCTHGHAGPATPGTGAPHRGVRRRHERVGVWA
jgi:hypothetical protein